MIALVPALAVALAAGPARADRTLNEELMDSKYPWGDYGLYFAWHRPDDIHFDVHGDAAFPVGVKVRVRWGDWIRLEGELSYFRASDEPNAVISAFETPNIDSLYLFTTAQIALLRSGLFRPYVGGGVAFLSVRNRMIVIRTELEENPEVPPDLVFATADWDAFDVGLHAIGGLDLDIGTRAFPFVEYRYLFGMLDIGRINIGLPENEDPEDLKDTEGRVLSDRYNWSGPWISAGLKIRF